MTKKFIVVFALLLSAMPVTFAQDQGYQRPGPYFGNDYGPGYGNTQPPTLNENEKEL